MANEILPAGIGDLTTQEAICAEFLMLLADRDISVLSHPALFHATAKDLTSTVVKVSHIGLGGYDLLSATTPGSAMGYTALTDGSTNVTIATRGKAYYADDLARMIAGGKVDPVLFAQDAALSVARTLISLLANIGDDFTSTAGSSGVDASWNDVVDAKTVLLIAKAQGPMLGILHPRQWGDLEADSLSLGSLPAQTMGGVINQGLEGQYKGKWFGIDFYTDSEVPTSDAGANRAGCIFTRGGMAWADAEMPSDGDPNIVSLGRARFERIRKGLEVATAYATTYACGVAKAIDGAGVTLKTDA